MSKRPGEAALVTGASGPDGAHLASPPPLDDDAFAYIVRHAPLVSVDIIIKDPQPHVLVGRRANEPAQGHYFVPGGVIRKNEAIHAAFARILKAETGLQASIDDTRFVGVFEHFYETNRFGDRDYGTHYVVLAYELKLEKRPLVRPDYQHNDIRWISEADIPLTPDVHPNTKAYFC
jgi:colanic acid biosynthesis protein WcaH